MCIISIDSCKEHEHVLVNPTQSLQCAAFQQEKRWSSFSPLLTSGMGFNRSWTGSPSYPRVCCVCVCVCALCIMDRNPHYNYRYTEELEYVLWLCWEHGHKYPHPLVAVLRHAGISRSGHTRRPFENSLWTKPQIVFFSSKLDKYTEQSKK